MSPRLQGFETEYGLAVLPGSPEPDLESIAVNWIEGFRGRLACLPPVNGNGWFLANGGRVYIDAGLHPEFCTPECASPFEAVLYLLAGDRLLQETTEEWSAGQEAGQRRMLLFKSNVDHLTGATWACHESYSHRTDPRRLPADLIPHLVSRIIFCGAGGLRPQSDAIQFCLSPRAQHLVNEISAESTHNRGIFHTKDESLAGPGWHRLHVLAGETLCSHRASVLKIGTTGLVLALVEAGLRPGESVQLARPLEALQTFNLDLEGRTQALLRNGRELSALEIQRHYLALARAHLGHEAMPPWAPRVCELWEETLDLLQQGPVAVAGMLDWGIKFTIHSRHLRQRGCEPQQLERWNQAAVACLAPPRTSPPTLEALVEFLARRGLDAPKPPATKPTGWSDREISFFRRLRAELAELEIRFGQLGEGGLFRALDQQGRLTHRPPGEITDEGIRRAMRQPPARGRARVRGNLIRELAQQCVKCACDWHYICDPQGRVLDLTDPMLEQAPKWQLPASA